MLSEISNCSNINRLAFIEPDACCADLVMFSLTGTTTWLYLLSNGFPQGLKIDDCYTHLLRLYK